MFARFVSFKEGLSTLYRSHRGVDGGLSFSSIDLADGSDLIHHEGSYDNIQLENIGRAHLLDTQQDDDNNSFDAHLEEAFEELVKQNVEEQLDIHKLNINKYMNDSTYKWRNGPAPVGETKSHEFKLTRLAEVSQDDDRPLNDSTKSLLNYFVQLSVSDEYGKIDYDLIENILHHADIDVKDEHGQSLFHEVARDWSVEFALFMKQRGAKLDEPDNYGRTPLIVSAAVNHSDMLQWLIENGADMHHRTTAGIENQCAIHYAAKYGSVDTFKMLVELGISPLMKDGKGRTPFFLAAYYGQEAMCRLMLDMELPTACYANNGDATIDMIISKLPTSLAERALDQFASVDQLNRIEHFYLSCMEKGRWRRLVTNMVNYKFKQYHPSTIHEILVENEDIELIQHPAVAKLISLKYERFGRKFINLNILITILYTLLWTTEVIVATHNNLGDMHSLETACVLGVVGFLLNIYFTYQLFRQYIVDSSILRNRKEFVEHEVSQEIKSCHPQWTFEGRFLAKQIELLQARKHGFWADGWNYVEILCLSLTYIEVFVFLYEMIVEETQLASTIAEYYSAFYIIIVWIRLNRCLRSVSGLGPFIAMLGQCVLATAQFAFLYFEFFIPFAAALWVTFGGKRKGFDDSEYRTIADLFYQVYLMSIIGDYDADTLRNVDKCFAQIYLCLVIFILSLVSLNLYIALLSEGVTRVNETATASTELMKAKEILFYEKSRDDLKRHFNDYINKSCAPLTVEFTRPVQGNNFRKMMSQLNKTAIVSEGLKEYADQLGSCYKDLETTKRQLEEFQDKYSLISMKEGLETAIRKTRQNSSK